MDVRAAARQYADLGWPVVRLRSRDKKCVDTDWQTRTYAPEDFEPEHNIGIKSQGGLMDVDCDCAEAVFMAEAFLPRTEAVYGRESRPKSHWLYRCPDVSTPAAHKDLIQKVMLIELRVNHQSMAPPSTHPNGERVRWAGDGPRQALAVERTLIVRAVQLCATGAMVARYYNPRGARHDWALALAGVLRRLGVTRPEAILIMTRAAEWARDDEIKDRLDAVRTTYGRDDNEPTTGANRLAEHIGEHGKAFVATLSGIWGAAGSEEGVHADHVDPATVDLVWERLVKHNEPATLFQRQRKIVMPVAEDVTSNFPQLFARQLKLQLRQAAREREGARFEEVHFDLFTEVLARSVRFWREAGRGKDKTNVSAYPNPRLVKQVMASPVCPLPVARGIIRTPSFDARGTLISTPGYHVESGVFYAPPPGFSLPEVPVSPTGEETSAALDLWQEMLCDFPFVDDAGRAHMLALPLTVVGRELINGPVPMCLVTKPVTGTGGTLMLQCVGWTVLGEPLAESSWSSDEEELRKYLTTLLMRGRPLINLDNITYLHSKDLLSVLSGDTGEDRRLGGNELVTIPNRAVFVGSGNNVTFNDEHAGRLYVVRLDAKVENPRLRDVTFRHPNLFEWVQQHRPQLVAGLVTLIQAWLAAGRPAYTGKRLAGFEAWSNVIGGVLRHVGVVGFLGNRDEVLQLSQRSQDEDLDFVTEWFLQPELMSRRVRTKELLVALMTVAPAAKAGSVATVVSLGRYLERNVDKVRTLDDGTVVAIRRVIDSHTVQPRWWLEVLHRPEGAGGGLRGDVVPF